MGRKRIKKLIETIKAPLPKTTRESGFHHGDTQLKRLNTGGEPITAVSIPDPPTRKKKR